MESKKNTVTQEQINKLYEESEKHVSVLWNKCTVVAIQLPNGFTIVEHSACVDPANYDEKIGLEICEEKIKNKLWELEGYNLQCKLRKLESNISLELIENVAKAKAQNVIDELVRTNKLRRE